MKAFIVGISLLTVLAAPSAFADSCPGDSSVGSTNGDWEANCAQDAKTSVWHYVLTNVKTGAKRTGPLLEIDTHVHLRVFVTQDGKRFAVLNETGGNSLAGNLHSKRLLIYESNGNLVTSLGTKEILTEDELRGVRTSYSHIHWMKEGTAKNLAGEDAIVLETLSGRRVVVSLADAKVVPNAAIP